MKAAMKVLAILTILIAFISLEQYSTVNADPPALESKALAYVENVLPFNMSHYNITINSSYSLPSGPNDPTITQAVDIDLKSNDSSIHVVCVYVNGILDQCGVSPTGTPVSDKTYPNLKDVAARILQAHQQRTGLDSTVLLKTLSLLNNIDSTNAVWGNVNLNVFKFPDIAGSQTVNGIPVPIPSNSSFSVNFHWMDTQNGVTISLFSLSFDNGVFYNLQDARPTNPTSDTISNISGQQAVQQENSTSPNVTSQPTNGTYAQTNQLSSESSQKAADQQNPIINPFLLAAVGAFAAVLIVFLACRRKNEAKENKLTF